MDTVLIRLLWPFHQFTSVLMFLQKVKYPPARDVQGDTDVY